MPGAKDVAKKIADSEKEKQEEGADAAEKSVKDSDEDSKPLGGEDARTPHEGGGQ